MVEGETHNATRKVEVAEVVGVNVRVWVGLVRAVRTADEEAVVFVEQTLAQQRQPLPLDPIAL